MLPSTTLVTLVLLALGGVAEGCTAAGLHERAAQEQKPVVLPLREVTEQSDRLVGQEIVVRGVLENKSANYFSRPRLVLKDEKGDEVNVREWLPLSVPPPGAATDAQRPTLATYLGKELQIRAVVRRANPAQPVVLEVQQAEIVRQP